MKPIAVVVGATGKQGTGIVETLLAGRAFQVRAISRDVSSAASKYLASLGAQLCEGSSSSVDQLTRHFAGAQAVFGQTPHNVPEDFEIAAALAQAKAASRAGVKSLVLSSLENVDKRSEGKYHVPFFTAKAQAVAQIQAEHPTLPLTVIQLAYFYTNLLERFRPRKQEDGQWLFSLPVPPDVPLPWTDPMTSVGPVVSAIFTNPKEYAGLTIPVVNELLTPTLLAQQFSEVTGFKARYEEMTQDTLFSWGLPESMAQWQWDMYQYTIHLGYYAPERDLSLSRRLDPNFMTWQGFLQQSRFDGNQTLTDVRSSQRKT